MVSSLLLGTRPRSYTLELSAPAPPTISNKMSATQDHSHALALQKYMLLQEQHEVLCTHLDQIRPTCTGTFSSPFSSPSTSPTRFSHGQPSTSPLAPRHHSRSSDRASGKQPRARARCSGWDEAHRGLQNTLDTIPDEETLYEISAEEQRLFDVNEGIKRTLMELLNCDAVRGDASFRMWVQTRLMETEKELRSGRRRRSS
ncbi:hypothetical protein NLU13_5791 [Sarocladium strictum]|uniref:Uncharacterized protein n=1 Tax=Sarocladium strictum TaxID=5046 RepID=A0AA39GID6_SARSR|nr:hypothetical protein NLU13_5791 [Sarocladium strictum]